MERWYRVFGGSGVLPAPGAILEHLAGLGARVRGDFSGVEAGWFRAELAFGGPAPLELERFLADEEGIRAELNSWAAHVESGGDSPDHVRLMERIIGTSQLFTLYQPGGGEEAPAEPLCVGLCRFLAQATGGVYQIDGQGFFAADGALLVAEVV